MPGRRAVRGGQDPCVALNAGGLPVAVTDAQVRKLMAELEKHGEIGKAAMRAGMDRKTARKYREAGKLPSELKTPRSWRTREDPFEDDWDYIRARMTQAPELEAKALF